MMVWQKVIVLYEDHATVESKRGKRYSVQIYEDVDTSEAVEALDRNEEVWADVAFDVELPYGRKGAEIQKLKIGKWER